MRQVRFDPSGPYHSVRVLVFARNRLFGLGVGPRSLGGRPAAFRTRRGRTCASGALRSRGSLLGRRALRLSCGAFAPALLEQFEPVHLDFHRGVPRGSSRAQTRRRGKDRHRRQRPVRARKARRFLTLRLWCAGLIRCTRRFEPSDFDLHRVTRRGSHRRVVLRLGAVVAGGNGGGRIDARSSPSGARGAALGSAFGVLF